MTARPNTLRHNMDVKSKTVGFSMTTKSKSLRSYMFVKLRGFKIFSILIIYIYIYIYSVNKANHLENGCQTVIFFLKRKKKGSKRMFLFVAKLYHHDIL